MKLASLAMGFDGTCGAWRLVCGERREGKANWIPASGYMAFVV